MVIEQLDGTRMLITLESEDLSVFELDPAKLSLANRSTRELFKQLLSLAAIKTGIVLRDKTVSVELLPYNSGCFILATVKSKKQRKIYKIKKYTSFFLIKFNLADNMLSAVKILYDKGFSKYNSSLYLYNGMYYLLISSKATIPDVVRLMLCEYGKVCPCSSLTAVRLDEIGTLICRNNLVAYLGKNL